MEFLSAFKSENQRPIVTQLLPGILAFWPYALIIYLNMPELPSYFDKTFLLFTGAIFFVIMSWGIGYLIEDIGSEIEVRLEKWHFSRQSIDKADFENTWNRFLMLEVDKLEKRYMMKYNRSILIRFKFELNISIAIFFMLIGQLSYQPFIHAPIACWRTIAYISVCIAVIIYLGLVEGYQSVKVLHTNRKLLVEEITKTRKGKKLS